MDRILTIATNPGDLVLDSFLGSGTTAAVAHKMGRRWIGIEMGAHAVTHCAPRLRKVIDGEQGGISESAGWRGGGGFTFYRLGEAVFDPDGRIAPGVAFPALAAHVWFSETGVPLILPQGGFGVGQPTAVQDHAGGMIDPKLGTMRSMVEGAGHERTARDEAPSTIGYADGPPPPPGEDLRGPFLGVHDSRGYALLYNGVLGDRRPQGGNVLTNATLALIRAAAEGFAGPMTVYGESTRLAPARLAAEGVTFKQTPYDVRAR